MNKKESFFTQVRAKLEDILMTSQYQEDAIKSISKLVHASYQNGVKTGEGKKGETKNPFYQANHDHDED